eukprot:scaffold42183_cov17-Tisochrysis_lutea.AAC.1
MVPPSRVGTSTKEGEGWDNQCWPGSLSSSSCVLWVCTKSPFAIINFMHAKETRTVTFPVNGPHWLPPYLQRGAESSLQDESLLIPLTQPAFQAHIANVPLSRYTRSLNPPNPLCAGAHFQTRGPRVAVAAAARGASEHPAGQRSIACAPPAGWLACVAA